MIDAAKIEELRGLLAADTSTDWQTIRSDPTEGADVWWICAKNAAGQEVELGSLQGGFPHPTREARARLIVAMRNALPALLDLAASEALVTELREKVERLTKALLRLQNGAAVALNVIPEDQQEGVVGNFLAAIHRECCAGLSAGQGADECKGVTP